VATHDLINVVVDSLSCDANREVQTLKTLVTNAMQCQSRSPNLRVIQQTAITAAATDPAR